MDVAVGTGAALLTEGARQVTVRGHRTIIQRDEDGHIARCMICHDDIAFHNQSHVTDRR